MLHHLTLFKILKMPLKSAEMLVQRCRYSNGHRKFKGQRTIFKVGQKDLKDFFAEVMLK